MPKAPDAITATIAGAVAHAAVTHGVGAELCAALVRSAVLQASRQWEASLKATIVEVIRGGCTSETLAQTSRDLSTSEKLAQPSSDLSTSEKLAQPSNDLSIQYNT